MKHWSVALVALAGLAGCAAGERPATLGSLGQQPPAALPPVHAPPVGREQAAAGYRTLVDQAPPGAVHAEALRRLGDLALESGQSGGQLALADAIVLYRDFLARYPGNPAGDRVLYQLARAYDLSGQPDAALAALDRLVAEHGDSPYREEAQFRRAEIRFVRGEYDAAQAAYAAVLQAGEASLYYEKALYKYAWCHFKRSRYESALDAFVRLLDAQLARGALGEASLAEGLGRAERELLEDALRAVALALSYLGEAGSVDRYFQRAGARAYEPLIYRRLGQLYADKARIRDAAQTYLGFIARYPRHRLAPDFHQRAIAAYQAGGFPSLVLDAKVAFVERYGVDSPYWQAHDQDVREAVRPLLAAHLRDLATHFHARARRTKQAVDYGEAARWYAAFLKSAPAHAEAPSMNFLLAECLSEAGRAAQAVTEFERTAYAYTRHPRSAEAGYAALLIYAELEKTDAGHAAQDWTARGVESALRFVEHFPEDARVVTVLSRTAERLFQRRDYRRAVATAERLLAQPGVDARARRTAWTVLGHARFELGEYEGAERAYRQTLAVLGPRDAARTAIVDRLAASVYKQAERYREAGDLRSAAAHFLRVAEAAPASSLRATAEYDAAAALIGLAEWPRAAAVLEAWRRDYPGHALQPGVTEKLAFVYTKTGQSGRAAREVERLAESAEDGARRRELLWEAATLYQSADEHQRAAAVYTRYIQRFPSPLEQALEARARLADIYREQGAVDKQRRWLKAIVQAEAKGEAQRTPRTRELAADASLRLAQPLARAYGQARLTVPLEASLKRKKRLMEQAIEAYTAVADYQVAAATTAATFHIGELYRDFARALLASERPPELSAEEREQYDILLEEEAYPFEERAIAIHEANVKRITDGLYDKWVKSSLAALAELQPVRYAKKERSEGYVDAIN